MCMHYYASSVCHWQVLRRHQADVGRANARSNLQFVGALLAAPAFLGSTTPLARGFGGHAALGPPYRLCPPSLGRASPAPTRVALCSPPNTGGAVCHRHPQLSDVARALERPKQSHRYQHEKVATGRVMQGWGRQPQLLGRLLLFERSDSLQFLLSPRPLPVSEEFLAVECRPLDHKSRHPGR